MSKKVQPHGYAVGFQAHQQLFGQENVIRSGGRVPPPGYSLDKRGRDGRGKLPPGLEKTQSCLFNPRPGILKRECPGSGVAQSFGARCFQLLCCQRETSLPGWRYGKTRDAASCLGLFKVAAS